MKVRHLKVSDFEQWVSMRHALWPDEDIDALRDHAGRMLRGDPTPFLKIQNFIAEDEHGMCGFLEASLRGCAEHCYSSPVGYIEGWCVVPHLRGRGIGSALVRAAEDWARAEGCTEMASDASVENKTSRKAHKALGYQEESPAVHFHKKL
jgi:aminoglycoside 6'-N-acetyltransferase I